MTQQFQQVLNKLEKAYEDLKRNHMAFQELEKVNFLKEIIKEQMRQETPNERTGTNENTHSPVR
jgi:uncharacterized protein (DUF342 family)